MSPLLSALGRTLSILAFFGGVFGLQAQSPVRAGGEYAIVGAQPQDQIHPDVAINERGGLVVWQDYAADGNGWGINARRLNSTLSGEYSVFRVNKMGYANQENPKVALLTNGTAVFTWQGGRDGAQNIYYRLMNTNGVFITVDTAANTFTDGQQAYPAIAASPDGGFVIVWTSEDQDGSFQGVFGQRFGERGEKVGQEFRVNITTQNSQRSPAVSYLRSGHFVVSWISELLLATSDSVVNESTRLNVAVNLYSRIHNALGEPVTGEFRVNNATNLICANPQIVPLETGGFLVSWSGKDILRPSDSWDVYGRSYTAAGVAVASNVVVNLSRYGDQFRPQGAALGGRQLIVWTSMGQDGSAEGVYGRFLSNGVPVGMDQRINTTTVSKQIQPVIASDTYSRLLVVWTSFVGRGNGFDLYAQRFEGEGAAQVRPPAPYVSALSQSRLSVTWPELAGYDLAEYQLTVDGASSPVQINQNYYVLTGLAPSSSHSFALSYRFADGRISPPSPTVQGTTWSDDSNDDTLPDDWQLQHWGTDQGNWAAGNEDSDSDGVTNYREFLTGTNPTDSNSVLRTRIHQDPGGRTLAWNAEPGFVYQVQTSTDLRNWTNIGQPHFAAANSCSVVLSNTGNRLFYRVIRIR